MNKYGVDGGMLVDRAGRGGFTYDLPSGQFLGDDGVYCGGYGVSLPGHEERIAMNAPAVERAAAVENYAERKQPELCRPNQYLGGWVEDGNLVLDLTVIVGERHAAMMLAEAWGQRAVYDFERGECIAVPAMA